MDRKDKTLMVMLFYLALIVIGGGGGFYWKKNDGLIIGVSAMTLLSAVLWFSVGKKYAESQKDFY